MHFQSIYIEDNFVPDVVQDQYRRKKIGIEVSLKEGDSTIDAVKVAEDFIAEYIKANTVYPEHNHIEERIIPEHLLPEIQVQEFPKEETPDTRTKEQKQIDLINSFTTIPKPDGLESMAIIVKGKDYLQEAYDKKMEELKQL